jgi:hypothetical protein
MDQNPYLRKCRCNVSGGGKCFWRKGHMPKCSHNTSSMEYVRKPNKKDDHEGKRSCSSTSSGGSINKYKNSISQTLLGSDT